ncbi:hypothetical protein SDC9_69205 [bioreactor metagenome]|uniref:O-antigen polysaccharide polymerase Wzy n=1 Tax=bioreactor metagenome TaxID=1076179 RepID=A0A644Y3N5_9ZZZZ
MFKKLVFVLEVTIIRLMNISIRKIVSIYMLFLYVLLSFVIVLSMEPNIEIMGLIGLGLLIVSLTTWKFMTDEIISSYVFFLCVAYIFLFGQSLLMPFNLINPDRDVLNLKFVNEVNLYKAQIYTLLCLASFHIGALFFYKKENMLLKHKYLNRNVLDESIRTVGVILLIISIVPYFLDLYQSIKIVMLYGYKGIYSEIKTLSGLNSIITKLSSYFIPGLICLIIGFRKMVKPRRTIYLLSFVVIALILYIGERNDAVIFLLVIVLIQHYFIKSINLKNSYKYILICIFLLVILSSIADVRGIQNRSLLHYIEYITENGLSFSILTDVFSELGWTMTPTIAVMNFVESGEPLRNGQTYVYSILSLIPNLGFWEIHPAAKVTSLGSWLQFKLGLSYGPGFSLVAESFLNFSWWGWIVFVFLGGYIVRILGLLTRDSAEYNPAVGCCILLFFNQSLFTIRDTFLGNVRAAVYFAIPIYLFIMFIDNEYKKRKIYD